MDQRQQQLVTDLCRVQDLVRELDQHLHAPCSSPSSVDQCRRLAAEIVALTDRSIGMAAAAAATTTPCSGAPSPLSDAGSDQHHPFFGRGGGSSPKKRKATTRWSDQVLVSAAGGAEGPAEDGHSWRKYGQKDILGARHPRSYYRCTHRNSQGCPATKQVQRTDADPAVFHVVYHGEHTCRPAVPGAARRPQHNPHAEGLLQGLGARLTVATDAAASAAVTAPPMTPESHPPRGAASPWSLASPVGSDCNNVYSCPVTGYGDLQEVVSAFATGSGAHQAALDTEFMAPEYFSEFDYQSFVIDAVDPMPSLYLQ